MKNINILLLCEDLLWISLVRKFSSSIYLNKVYIRRSYKSIYEKADNIEYVNLDNIKDCYEFVKKNNINFVVVTGLYVNRGLVNYFKYNLGIPTFGITKSWLELECLKCLGKEFMAKHNIPTSEYMIVKNKKELDEAIEEYGYPIIIKDNKQQAGFGTYICRTKKECLRKAKKILKEDTFFIAERYIEGEEVTLHTLWDGKILIPLEPVRDYKRLKNNNEGINTGSMGSYVPVKLTDGKKALINKYVKKLEEVFQEVKPNFTGVFASDLIFTEENIYNLEFNMRPCTPEFEVLIEHIDSDLLEIMYKTAVSELEGVEINYKPGITGAVNVVHKDYKYFPNIVETRKIKIPKNFLKGSKDIVINFNIKDIDEKGNAKIYTNINIFVIMKNDSKNPFPDLYEYISRIKDKNIYYRTDIGEN